MEKILLVDDHSIIRSGLKIMLGSDFSNYAFDEAATGEDFELQVGKNNYALIILDINIPGTDTFEMVKNALKKKPDTRILIFSMNAENMYAKRFFKAGVKGYVRKDEHCDEIKAAVADVLNNKRYVSRSFGEALASEKFQKPTDNPFDRLSPKQIEIARFLVQGKTITDICMCMQLHSSTISTQKTRIFEKLKVDNIVDLYALAKVHVAVMN